MADGGHRVVPGSACCSVGNQDKLPGCSADELGLAGWYSIVCKERMAVMPENLKIGGPGKGAVDSWV